MSEEQYWGLLNYLIVFNTIPSIVNAALCLVWAFSITRAASKQVVFAMFAGIMFSAVLLRIGVTLLPQNLTLIVLIGVVNGINGIIQSAIFITVTFVVRKRMKEFDEAAKCRGEACKTPQAEKFDAFESRMFSIGQRYGLM